MTKIRVLVAEDHATVRQGLQLLIDGQPDMEVIGEAPDGKVVVALAAELSPTVVVLDLAMPGLNGLGAAREMATAAPAAAIVVLTRYNDQAYVQALQTAGAYGYVLKQSPSTELLRAIRMAASGERYIDSALIRPVARFSVDGRAIEKKPRVSERESDVLRLIALGNSNKEIAVHLNLSVKTVEVHKANAVRKLGLNGRIDIVRYAVLQGWLQEP